MFDLDELEKNWQEYYRTKYGKDNLSNIDILEIYKSENATQEYYNKRRDEYDIKFRKMWKIVHDDSFPLINHNHKIGWDEDISNLDKDEFLREYEEFKALKHVYNDYQYEEYDREDDILMQLRAEDRFDFSKIHENDEDFLSGSDVNPTDFGVDKDFVSHNPSYYIDDDVLEIDELEYECNYDYRKVKDHESRMRNIASRIIMEKAENEKPKEIRLSPEKQKDVVEGCMHLVFEQTRYWDEVLGHAFDIEELYYICLRSLISSANCCHYVQPVFPNLVYENIRKSMYSLMARRLHISYRELYEKMEYHELDHESTSPDDRQLYDIPSKPTFLIPTDPKKIFLMTKDIPTEEEHEKESDAFMEAYYQELNKLGGLEKYVMTMAYNSDGFPGLTNAEIADNLMIDINTVNSLKKKALLKLRKKESIKK